MEALEMTLLYDYYGGMLTEKQRECFDMRYNQDLSLGEIGLILGISRQAVCDNLSRTEALLRKMEDNIGCVSRNLKTRQSLGEIYRVAQQLEHSTDSQTRALAQEILTAARKLEE